MKTIISCSGFAATPGELVPTTGYAAYFPTNSAVRPLAKYRLLIATYFVFVERSLPDPGLTNF